jgi:hypothetical protein
MVCPILFLSYTFMFFHFIICLRGNISVKLCPWMFGDNEYVTKCFQSGLSCSSDAYDNVNIKTNCSYRNDILDQL